MTDQDSARRSPMSTERAKMMIPAVHRIARRICRKLPPHVDQADVIGAGMVGLAEALERREGDDDTEFHAYALRRIRGEMMEQLRRMDPLTRVQRNRVRTISRAEQEARRTKGTLPPPAMLAKTVGMTERDVLETRALRDHQTTRSLDGLHSILPSADRDVVEALDRERELLSLTRAISDLPLRLQRALACFDDGLTLREVGVELGVTEGRVCQLRQEAVAQLRQTLQPSTAA